TYCVPGYTGSKSNCVGVSSQAFLDYYCSKLPSSQCTVSSCARTTSGNMVFSSSSGNPLIYYCKLADLPSACKTTEYKEDQKTYGISGVFYRTISEANICGSGTKQPSVDTSCVTGKFLIKDKGYTCYDEESKTVKALACSKAVAPACKSNCNSYVSFCDKDGVKECCDAYKKCCAA
ncbi:hypothetical protein KY363_00410, partial [Candidatus Woesearchaeota archaeon]|nr:hypothetical protein [Candidatus Woesearchaeota archaeon]